MTAMPQECQLLEERFGARHVERIGNRRFTLTESEGLELFIAVSHIGKVAAAATASILLHRFGVEGLFFTGVAGGVGSRVLVGDIVVADNLLQHDLDLKGVLGHQRFEVPSLGRAHIAADSDFLKIACDAANAVAADGKYRRAAEQISSRKPAVHCGVIASGDRFVNSAREKTELVSAIPGLLAVEMEGAAVAQVCAEHSVPCAVVRIISDAAADTAEVDFKTFIESAAAIGSEDIVCEFLKRMPR
jgi:adenosylhomocysteine nucleosidase